MGSIMIQGTGTGVGKTTIGAALCRILRQDGRAVMPFKPQSFSASSFITADECEISSLISIQAAAAKQQPDILMNPILAKPSVNSKYQIIIMGKPFQTMTLAEYIQYTPNLLDMVVSAYDVLVAQNDHVIVTGMGSPAEPHLKNLDIANMSFAERTNLPVILVADISKGGAAATINGTLSLLGERSKRVCGVILNCCSADKLVKDSIASAIDIPILGYIPCLPQLNLIENHVAEDISIEVIKLPNMRNQSSIQPLEDRTDVNTRYISAPGKSKDPDILIIPDSSSKSSALSFLRESGFDMFIRRMAMESKLIIGMGTGFSAMGTGLDELGLIDMHTQKLDRKKSGDIWVELGENPSPYFYSLALTRIAGYESRTEAPILGPTARMATGAAGAFSAAGNVFGTYVNGLFDNEPFLDGLLHNIKSIKGLNNTGAHMTPDRQRDLVLDTIADLVRENIDIEKIYQIIGD